MNGSQARVLRIRKGDPARCASGWLDVFLLASAILWLQNCYTDPRPALKDRIVGDWEDASKEVMHFKPDWTLVMDSPREHHQCIYDFPDTKHLRLNCAPAGTPASQEVWKMSFADENTLLISDEHETGTYKRK